MDTFHFSTVWTAIFTNLLLLLIITVIFCHKKILLNAGYKLIAVFLILNMVRLFLPIEFPFATSIALPQGISKVIIEFFEPRFFTESYPTSICGLVVIIWILGILFKTWLFIRINGMIKRFIFIFGRNVTKESPYVTIMNEICETKENPYQIYEVTDISGPMIFGFRTPYILIPAGQDYDTKTLTYILKHEISHHKHHDLWLKFGIQLLCIIYWWNPCSYILRRQLSLVIEMRIDDTITGSSEEEAKDYLNCLDDMAEKKNNIFNHKLGNIISFSQVLNTDLTRRFDMLMKRNGKKKRSINFILLCLIVLIFIFSYSFIFEAYYFIPEVHEVGFRIGDVDAFAVDNEDGTYNIYILNIFVDRVTSFEYYGNDIPILTKEEFEHVQQNLSEQD